VRAFDVTLGVEPGLWLSRLIAAVPPIGSIATFVYAATPLGFALLYVLQRRSRVESPIDALSAFALVSVAGFTLYHALPVVGPCFVFKDWGAALRTLPALPLSPMAAVDEPRNCVPSLHTAWALLIFWHTRQQPLGVRLAAGLFSGFTLLATLGFGLHYVADLVVAVPFTVAAQALAAPPSPARRRALLVGVGLTGLWFLLLRSGALVACSSPVVSWTLVLLTVGTGLYLERRLWQSSVALTAASA
jgi:hypothetical protein